MTKRRVVQSEAVLDPELTTRPQGTQPKPITDDDELEDVFSDFPQNESCIELWRTTAQGGRPEFLEQMTPSAFSFAYVTDTYGGGRYVAKGKYKNGDAEKRSFTIAGDPFPVRRKMERGVETDHPRTPVQELAIAQVPKLPEGAGMQDMFMALVAMMQKMMLESKTSEVEMLTKMKMYKELFSDGGGGSHEKNSVAEMISMVRTGIELGQAGGEGSGGIPWLMVLDKVKEPLSKLADSVFVAVSAYKGAPQPALTNVPTQAVPVTAQPGTNKPEEENMEIILLGALRAMLPMLVTGAAQRSEPPFYADLLLDQIPRQYYATAKTWLDKEGCLDELVKMNPGVGMYRPWFDTLRQELRTSLAEEIKVDASESIQPESSSDPSALSPADIPKVP